jgi:hypothetical protein
MYFKFDSAFSKETFSRRLSPVFAFTVPTSNLHVAAGLYYEHNTDPSTMTIRPVKFTPE